MVRGLDRFARHFAGFEQCYVLIGGAACDLWLSKAQFRARATKDLDLVLVLEAVDASFIARFWEFIREGGYARGEYDSGTRRSYRFAKPAIDDFPYMLELFSRTPDLLESGDPGSIVPIPVEASLSRLSAILLDEASYRFVLAAREEEGGIMVLSPTALIPLKAAAYVDLRDQRLGGGPVDSDDLSKHRNDVLRLALLLSEDTRTSLPVSLADSLRVLLADIEATPPDWISLRKSMGMPGRIDGHALLGLLRLVYGL